MAGKENDEWWLYEYHFHYISTWVIPISSAKHPRDDKIRLQLKCLSQGKRILVLALILYGLKVFPFRISYFTPYMCFSESYFLTLSFTNFSQSCKKWKWKKFCFSFLMFLNNVYLSSFEIEMLFSCWCASTWDCYGVFHFLFVRLFSFYYFFTKNYFIKN